MIAFSLAGLLLYALQLLPNIIWLAMPPANDVLKHNSSPHAAQVLATVRISPGEPCRQCTATAARCSEHHQHIWKHE